MLCTMTEGGGNTGLGVTQGQEALVSPGVEAADGHRDAGVHDEEEHEGQDHGQHGVSPRQHSHDVQVVEVSMTHKAVLIPAHCRRPQGAAIHGHRRRYQHSHHRLGRYLTITTIVCYRGGNITQSETSFRLLFKSDCLQGALQEHERFMGKHT